jgi:peptide/nickel transport system substrate-binding protein
MRRAAVRVLPVLTMLIGLLAACGGGKAGSKSSTASSVGKAVHGGTATFAETPGAAPDYIFPIYPAVDSTVYNIRQFFNLLYRPLVWEGTGENTRIDRTKSLFSSIVYSQGGKTVTITLKPYKWSDGAPVSARDLTFFMNLVKANKADFGGYTKGELPDNVVSYQATGPRTVVFHLNAAYNELWFTDDQLGLITPLPQQAWDKESASGKVGNYDETPAGAKKVFAFLTSQAKNLKTYATNPLWKVVDGPWQLVEYDSNGKAVFVPNPHYSGPDKPKLSRFVELPFTADSSEFSVLRAGTSLDVGFVPTEDLKEQAPLTAEGYRMTPWVDFGIDYMVYNFRSKTAGPLVRELYIRQALQHLVDQPLIIREIYDGYAHPTYGPVPTAPPSDLASPFEKRNPYPFSIGDAKKLLASHGWTIRPNGVDTCARPGSGAGDCGAGITKGERLALSLLYSAGNAPFTRQAETLKSYAGEAGIDLALSSQPFNTVVGTMGTTNTWDIGEYGGFSFFAVPTGQSLLESGGSLNLGHYSNAVDDRNIESSLHSNSLAALYLYQDYLAKQLPLLWVPTPDTRLSEIKSNLHGVTPQNAFLTLSPEDWYFTQK